MSRSRRPSTPTSREFLERTRDYWLNWVRSLAIPLEYQTEVIRAAITLKLCNYEDTGAIIAAHTTSIPEAPGTQRNWDYRYCWLRDAFFVIKALNRLGATQTMEEYIHYITNIAVDADRPLRPVYGIVPPDPLDERIAPDLAGFEGTAPSGSATRRPSSCSTTPTAASSSPPRRCSSTSGCRAWAMRPCSAGSSRSASRRCASPWSRMPGPGSIAAASACTRTRRPCAGWPAIGWRASPLASASPDRAAHWRGEADKLREEILKRAWNERRGVIAGALDGEELDASVLLLPELGLLPANDERFIRTCRTIGKELNRNGFIMRYTADDDFGAPETAFLVCQFWYIDALLLLGQRDEARGAVRRPADAPQCLRHPVGGHSSRHRRAVGQPARKPIRWPASSIRAAFCRAAGRRPGPRPEPVALADVVLQLRNLQRCRAFSYCAQAALMPPSAPTTAPGDKGSMSRLVLVSNRVLDLRKAAQAGGMAVALADVVRERKAASGSAGTARRRTPSTPTW